MEESGAEAIKNRKSVRVDIAPIIERFVSEPTDDGSEQASGNREFPRSYRGISFCGIERTDHVFV